MTLAERIDADIKEAMRARERGKERLAVLRLTKASVKNQEIDLKRPLTDDEVREVLAREVKQRREVLPDYERSGRADLVEHLKQEITVLQEYLPSPLDEAELRRLIKEAIATSGAQGLKDLGKVMGPLMPQLRGRADGKHVNMLVKEMLQAR